MTTLPTWRLRTLHEAAAGSRGNMPEGLQPHQVIATVAVRACYGRLELTARYGIDDSMTDHVAGFNIAPAREVPSVRRRRPSESRTT